MTQAQDTERYGILVELFTAMEKTQSVDDLAWLGASAARRILKAASASVSRYDAESGAVRTLANAGDLGPGEQERPESESYWVTDFPYLLQVAERQVPWTLDVDDESGDAAEIALLASLGKTSAMGCPIVLGQRVWGELYLTRAGQARFLPHERAVAHMIAQAIALCIGRLIGRDELRELVYVDALTGLGNRRRADEVLAEACGQGVTVTVAIWDVDGLKVVNDRDGHLAGDRLLREVALLLSEGASLLPGAVATRLGGDEFCLIAVDRSGAEVTAALADLVRRATGLAEGAGVSCGVASVVNSDNGPLAPMDTKALLRRADTALYRAKRAGGGRQELSTAPGDQRVSPTGRGFTAATVG